MPLLRYDVSVRANGREKSIHETGTLPAAAYQDDVAVHRVAWHWHEEFELFHLLEGSIWFLVESNEFEINAGEAVFINAELLHGAWNNQTETCSYHSLVFHPRLIGGSTTSVFWQKYVDPLRLNRMLPYLFLCPEVGWQSDVINAVEQTWKEIKMQEPGYEFCVREKLSSIIWQIFAHGGEYAQETTTAGKREELRVKQMISYVRIHFAEDITVRDIAAAAFISNTECMRCFRNILHTTPGRYLRQHRIRNTERLLRTTNAKVEEIACSCGFGDMGYFARCFREEYGTTPLSYRKKKIWEKKQISGTDHRQKL